MQILYAPGFMAAIIFALVSSSVTGNAVVLYPWCANYSGRGGYGPANCGYVTFQQCLATLAGNGGTCAPNPFYQPYPPPTTYSPPIRR